MDSVKGFMNDNPQLKDFADGLQNFVQQAEALKVLNLNLKKKVLVPSFNLGSVLGRTYQSPLNKCKK